MVHVKLLGGDRAGRVFESGAIERLLSAQDSVDQREIAIELARAPGLETGKNGERFLQIVESFRIAGISFVPGDNRVDLPLRFVLPLR